MKNFIIIGAVIILAIAGIWYWQTSQSENPGDTSRDTANLTNNDEVTSSEDATTTGESNGTFASLFTSGKNQSCKYSYVDPDGQTLSGAVYISGNKMRSDYEMVQADTTVTGSMIQEGETLYIWASNMPEGIKMNYSLQEAAENNENNSNTADQNPTPIDPNVEMDFNCTNWNPDNSVFTPPSNVTFRDVSAMMESLQGDPNGNNKCALCDSLSGTDQQTCREQLGCE